MEVIRGHLGCPLSGGCPLFGGSAIGGSTVYIYIYKYKENSDNSTDKGGSFRSPIN